MGLHDYTSAPQILAWNKFSVSSLEDDFPSLDMDTIMDILEFHVKFRRRMLPFFDFVDGDAPNVDRWLCEDLNKFRRANAQVG